MGWRRKRLQERQARRLEAAARAILASEGEPYDGPAIFSSPQTKVQMAIATAGMVIAAIDSVS